jgi:phage baseplate assembly protein W
MPIKINIPSPKTASTNVIFKDVNLDMAIEEIASTELNKEAEPRLKTDINIKAIENSIINILSTSPGQKILNPTFGTSLGNLLFLPVTKARGDVIAEVMLRNIRKFEPRVKITKFNIVANTDADEYFINILYNIPAFSDNPFNLRGRLDKARFYAI